MRPIVSRFDGETELLRIEVMPLNVPSRVSEFRTKTLKRSVDLCFYAFEISR